MKSNKAERKQKLVNAKVAKIWTLKAKGYSIQKIADKVGLTFSGVSYHLYK